MNENIHKAGFAYGFNTAAFFPWLDPYERTELSVAPALWVDYQNEYKEGWIEGFKLALELMYAAKTEALTGGDSTKQSDRVHTKVSH